MKITLLLAAATAAAIVAATAAAAQTDDGKASRPIEGTVGGGPTRYSAVYGAERLTLSGTYRSTALGAGTFVADLQAQTPYASECTFCASAPAPVGGTATFSSGRGTLTGEIGPGSTIVYSQQPHGVSYDVVLRLRFVDGTRAFATSTVELNLIYSTGINFYGPAPEEWANGSLNGFVTHDGRNP